MRCLNCDGRLVAGRLLFCSEECSEFARTVRYHRRVVADGRIERADVRAALNVRMAYALWGHAPQKPLSDASRAAVFAAKGNRCLRCGSPATDLDHVVSAYFGDDSTANLEPLCHECHLEKTLASPMPWDTASPTALGVHEERVQDYGMRVEAMDPFRICDDHVAWPHQWRSMLAARSQQSLDQELADLLEIVAHDASQGDGTEAFLLATATIAGRPRLFSRFEELAEGVLDDLSASHSRRPDAAPNA